MPSEYTKPLPVAQPESDRYWEGARNSELWLQRCESCHSTQFYPRRFCTACGSRDVGWLRATGRGTLYTFTIVHRPPHPGFADDLPYIAAIVELEEGPRVPTNVVGVDPAPENLEIGMPVRAVFEKATDQVTLPKFTPA
ncbi:MAG: Zn-ribbon domain-containing OB-fold protein [Dehalococcoidia bacterium]